MTKYIKYLLALLSLPILLAGCMAERWEMYEREESSTKTPFISEDGEGNNWGWESSTSPQMTIAPNMVALNVHPAPDLQLTLQPYDGGFFTMDIPAGCVIETTGEYEDFGFRAFDSANPARQIFFYGNMRYFLKSTEGKSAWEMYLANGGYADAQVFVDAPVLSPPTTEQFFYTFDTFTAYAAQYGINHNFPEFMELEVVESMPRNSPISSVCLDDSILRGLFIQGGVSCEGLLAAGIADTMTSYMYNVDAGYYTAYVITGITAPADEFYQMEEMLAQALASFTFQDSYIQQGVAQKRWETQVALQVGRTLSEAADSYNRAWFERQRVYDALSQKRSDATMGYDRLYDTVTGNVYRAELGFYDAYDINRELYENPNLQLVPDDGYDLYDQNISGYIYQ